MLLRISAFIVLFFFILFFPFWVSLLVSVGAMVYFSFFFEAALLFLLSDLLYAIPEERYFGIVFSSFIFAIVVLSVVEFIKKKIRAA